MLKILVADDECLIANTLAKILDNSGFETAVVYSGDQAVEIADTLRPDVFISDVIMPGLTGIQAAIQIRKILPACRVLLLSGQHETTELLDGARSLGYQFDILAKPVPPGDLLARLDELIKERGEIARTSESGIQP